MFPVRRELERKLQVGGALCSTAGSSPGFTFFQLGLLQGCFLIRLNMGAYTSSWGQETPAVQCIWIRHLTLHFWIAGLGLHTHSMELCCVTF